MTITSNSFQTVFHYWASRFDCDVALLHTSGSTILPEEQLHGENRFYLYTIGQHSFLRCDPLLVESMQQLLAQCPANKTIAEANLHAFFGARLHTDGHHPHFYLQASHFQPTPSPDGIVMRRLREDEHGRLDHFLDNCTATDIEFADIKRDNPDPVIICGFDGDQIVAYASYRPVSAYGGDPQYGDQIGDIGVLIHADYRGWGLGKAIVAAQSQWCLENNVTPQYQVLETNRHSYRIPIALGYQQLLSIRVYNLDTN